MFNAAQFATTRRHFREANPACRRAKSKRTNRLRILIGLLIALLVAAGIQAAPAAADSWITAFGNGAAVVVETGAKNYSNHTQYVVGISVLPPDNGAWCDTVDAWTQNWYHGQVTGCSNGYWFYIERWVASGNYVCGRVFDYHYGTWGTACIAIRV